jgi:flagellar hook-basal body complex protein FliE
MPTVPPIDTSGFGLTGPEWNVQGIPDVAPGTADSTGAATGEGFGQMLAGQVQALDSSQKGAAGAAQSLIDGTASDPSSVVMAVERARLSMQLASQIRTKAVEAYQDIFHTQV